MMVMSPAAEPSGYSYVTKLPAVTAGNALKNRGNYPI